MIYKSQITASRDAEVGLHHVYVQVVAAKVRT